MVTCFTSVINSRITYSFQLILEQFLGVSVRIIDNKEEFTNFTGPKINYSHEKLGGLWIFPSDLLLERGINPKKPDILIFRDIPCLFPGKDGASLPFDPFASAFYMVTRYEEYLDVSKDLYGRSKAMNSLAFRYGFLETPVVDHWALMVHSALVKLYPNFKFPLRKFKYIPTMDIDIAFAYMHHGWIRYLGGTVKDLLKTDFNKVFERFTVCLLGNKDPFDVYALLEEWYANVQFNPIFFFHLGNYGKFDKNIPFHHPAIVNLIQRLHNSFQIGIHPSYASFGKEEIICKEMKRLENIIQQKVEISRQHFLKLDFPDTYRQLQACGIRQDYSMGYADAPGFRAGCCTPFRFFDLGIEKESSLTIYPFQVMDGTLNQYLGLSIESAEEKVQELIQKIKGVRGTFISLWHNESLGERGIWKGWRSVYIQLLKYANEQYMVDM